MDEIVEQVTGLIHEVAPWAPRQALYGGVAFMQGHTPVVAVLRRADFVAVEITGGANLDDLYEVLQGDGFRRHIAVYDEQDIDDKHVAEYVQAAFRFHA